MNRDKQVCPAVIRDFGTFLERDEGVVAARVHDFHTELILYERAEALGDIQNQFFFDQAAFSGAAMVVAAVARIDDHPPQLHPQRDERRLRARRVGRERISHT